MLAARVHRDLFGAIFDAVIAFEFCGYCCFQRRDAIDRCIFGLAASDRFDCGIFHKIRRVEIWLAGRQTDHVYPLRLQVDYAAGHGERSRGCDPAKGSGQVVDHNGSFRQFLLASCGAGPSEALKITQLLWRVSDPERYFRRKNSGQGRRR